MLATIIETFDNDVNGEVKIVDDSTLESKIMITTTYGDHFHLFLDDDDLHMSSALSIQDLQDLQRGIQRLLAAVVGEQLCLMPQQQS